MISPGRNILKAWYELLNDNITIDSNLIPVFRMDAPSGQTGHYILIRMEGGSTRNTNSSFDSNHIVVIDIVTQFDNKIDDSVVFDISTEIDKLVFPDPAHHGLPEQSDIQIIKVVKENETVLPEDDGAIPKINRLVSRYSHRIHQTVAA